MGQNKADLSLDGQTLLQRTLEVVGTVAREVLVVGGEPLPQPPSMVRFVPDELAAAGPLGGLATGLRSIDEPYAVVVACDHPFLDASLLAYLVSLAPGHEAVLPTVDGRRQVLHAVYARTVAGAADALLEAGNLKLEALLDGLRIRYVTETEIDGLDPEHLSFVNVNTPDEWQAALNRHRAQKTP
jgi:molybdopterin-guanine dinucleotide biosynthesis protein A